MYLLNIHCKLAFIPGLHEITKMLVFIGQAIAEVYTSPEQSHANLYQWQLFLSRQWCRVRLTINWSLSKCSFYCVYIRLFENPQPASSKIVEAVDSLKLAVEGRLKSKSRLALTINFPSHIFRYLFEGKGEVSGGWLYADEKAFDRRYYPQNWDECLDSFGEGHKICYPVRMRIFLFWSPKRFIKVKNGELHPCSIMAYQERLSLPLARSPC